MKTVTPNCKVELKFEDGQGVYLFGGLVSSLSSVSLSSPLGKAIFGKAEGEEVQFQNSVGTVVRVKILKIFESRNVYI